MNINTFFNKLVANPTMMTWANHFTVFAHGLLVTPLIIIIFSKDQISVWYLLQTLVGLGMLADAGFGFTLSRAVAFFYAGAVRLPANQKEYSQTLENQGSINTEKLASLLSTSFRVYLILSLAFILVFTPVGMAVMWNVMTLTGHDVYLWSAFGLVIASTFVSLQTIKWSAYMNGTRRVAEVNRYNAMVGIVRILGYVLLLSFKTGVFGLSLYTFLEGLFSNLYLRRKVHSWFKDKGIPLKGKLFFDKEIFSSLWTATWRLGLTTWGNYVAVYGTSLIISQVKNTSLMADFLFTQKILGFIQRIAEAPFYANVPGIYSFMAQKKEKEVKKEISKQLFLVITLLAAGFIFIGLFGNFLLDAVNIDIRFVPGWIYFVFALSIFLDSHATMQGTVYISTNHVPFLWPSLISGAVMLAVGFLILPIYGLIGIVMVKFLVALSMGNWYSTYLSLRLLNWRFSEYLEDIWVKGFLYWKLKAKSFVNPVSR
jgi:hypothetical protein